LFSWPFQLVFSYFHRPVLFFATILLPHAHTLLTFSDIAKLRQSFRHFHRDASRFSVTEAHFFFFRFLSPAARTIDARRQRDAITPPLFRADAAAAIAPFRDLHASAAACRRRLFDISQIIPHARRRMRLRFSLRHRRADVFRRIVSSLFRLPYSADTLLNYSIILLFADSACADFDAPRHYFRHDACFFAIRLRLMLSLPFASRCPDASRQASALSISWLTDCPVSRLFATLPSITPPRRLSLCLSPVIFFD